MKINKNIIAKDLDSPLQLIEIEIEDSYITGEVLVGSGSYVKGKVYKMPYINFQLVETKIETPKHYNNDNGTLYKIAEERGWNSYLFDIVKRLERSEKKGEFISDLEKSKVVIDLWLKESEKEM
jgi:hypothetical protein